MSYMKFCYNVVYSQAKTSLSPKGMFFIYGLPHKGCILAQQCAMLSKKTILIRKTTSKIT